VHVQTRDDRPRTWPPGQVQQVTGTFLELVDERRPGLVEGLYLHGSLGFGEWYDGRSDVDYVALLADRPDQETTELLREVHAALGETFPRPAFDGPHLTWADLARTPYDCPEVPCTLAGSFGPGRVDVNPVTWHELAQHGVTLHGPPLEEVTLRVDQGELRAYTHSNLASYWTEAVAALGKAPDQAADPDTVAWFVLGTARLHHLLVTDTLTSKTGAGRYAADAFGERWRPLVTEALSARVSGELTGAIAAERLGREVVDFASMVIEAGLAIVP